MERGAMNAHAGHEGYEGIVEDIIYYNEETGFVIAALDIGDVLLSIKGQIPFVSEGDRLRVEGYMSCHDIYGDQLVVTRAEIIEPEAQEDIYRYLASGVITGIGPATARIIVDSFGSEALDVIRNDPGRLLALPGIGPKKRDQITASFKEQDALRSIVMYFQRLSISTNLAMKIYKTYGDTAIDVIERNPYLLAESVSGMGFKQADAIAMRIGIDHHSPFRIASGILHALGVRASAGDTYAVQTELMHVVSDALSVEPEAVEAQIHNMAVLGALQLEALEEQETPLQRGDAPVAVYLPALHYAEQQVAAKVCALKAAAASVETRGALVDAPGDAMRSATEDDLDTWIAAYESRKGLRLAQGQKDAIRCALSGGVSVITGGPGTGKTTLINAIIEAYEQLTSASDVAIALAAPTGRAAKRMAEATRREAKTIHRLLEFQGGPPQGDVTGAEGAGTAFQRNADNPLDAEVLIIDEISMVDMVLMYRLLDAVELGTRLILVGDADQLPSVGPGAVLRDLIGSGVVALIRLDTVFRQGDASLIAVNAHLINRGEAPILNKSDKDFFFISDRHPDAMRKTLQELIRTRIPDYYGMDPREDIQVLSPMKGSPLGVEALNALLQDTLNPPAPEKREQIFGKKCLRVGDKVMQIRNNYMLEWQTQSGEVGSGVFNGDIGIVLDIDVDGRRLEVIFDGERTVTYDFQTADELVLAYAVTVHKSQGSEFKAVIMPLYHIPPVLATRNILYTAITRGRELVILVGDKQIMQHMIHHTHEDKRRSRLRYKLETYGGHISC